MIEKGAFRWEKETKFYQATLKKDLLGDFVVHVLRGSKVSNASVSRSVLVSSINEGILKIENIGKIRLRHGYERVRN